MVLVGFMRYLPFPLFFLSAAQKYAGKNDLAWRHRNDTHQHFPDPSFLLRIDEIPSGHSSRQIHSPKQYPQQQNNGVPNGRPSEFAAF